MVCKAARVSLGVASGVVGGYGLRNTGDPIRQEEMLVQTVFAPEEDSY